MLKKLYQASFLNKLGLVLITFGTFIWSLTMVKSGLTYSYGMGFWGPNGHDGVWHISLIQSLSEGSWRMPVFAGEDIKNYHIGFDLAVAVLHKITLIPIVNLYFQAVPPILAFLIGFFSYKFVYFWKKSHIQAFWATFFVYFGGSWGWVITFLRNKDIGGESLFWAQQAISTLINPPFALSLVLIFAGLYYLVNGIQVEDKKHLIIATFIFGFLVQIKVYAMVLILLGLSVSGFWRFVKRKGVSLIKVAVGTLVISIILFSPTSRDITSTFLFKPFWFLEQMMSARDRFYWPRYAEAMTNYRLAGNLAKGVVAYLAAFAIFWAGNLGTRIIKEIAVFRWLKDWKKVSYLEIFFAVVIISGIAIPTFFVQSGTPWNTIQFMYYSLTFSGVLAGVWFGSWLESTRYRTKRYLAVIAVILLTLPTTAGTLKHYLPSRPPAKISNEEMEALAFLSKQPSGIVLTLPYDSVAAQAAVANPPRPLYLYESTAYVSAFSGKPVYLGDEVNLGITGYDWRARREKLFQFLRTSDINLAQEFLVQNKISYIYWLKGVYGGIRDDQNVVNKIFENSEIQIFKFSS